MWLSAAAPLQAQHPVINEVLPSNHDVNMDPDRYAFSDWIELYNPSSFTVDLSQYYLSDDRDNLKKWRFPYGKKVSPGGYLLLWADGQTFQDQALHLNFRLNKEGGTVYLTGPQGMIVDSLAWPSILPDISYGRYPLAAAPLQFFPHPTPGRANTGEGVAWLLPSQPPQVSVNGGFYGHPVQVYLFSDNKNAIIRYTLDGSEPTASSTRYTGPLTLSRTTVLRATAFEPGRL